MLGCIYLSYFVGPIVNHFECFAWSFSPTQVLKALILFLGDKRGLLMSLIYIYSFPYLCTKYFLRSPCSHIALLHHKDKSHRLVFPPLVKHTFYINNNHYWRKLHPPKMKHTSKKQSTNQILSDKVHFRRKRTSCPLKRALFINKDLISLKSALRELECTLEQQLQSFDSKHCALLMKNEASFFS